jgi:hypothetical protein
MTPEQHEKAKLDPQEVFDTPEAVLEVADLTSEQKIEILLRWEYNAAEEAVATEEGMPGNDKDMLRRVLLALGKLGARVDVEHPGPTKQHGLLGTCPPKQR